MSTLPQPGEDQEKLRERARGCLVGAAVGDAFGMPLEFQQPRRKSEWLNDMTDGRLQRGTFTDDTEMMLALAESLIAHYPLEPADLAHRFVDWYRRDPSDIGNHTWAVLSRLVQAGDWQRAAREVQQRNPDSAGNGSVMRCFPVALAYRTDLNVCLDASGLQSAVTHSHPECISACKFVNAFIWYVLQGESVASALELALGAVTEMPDELRTTIEDAPNRYFAELPNSGWVRHTVESAVWGLTTTTCYRDAVIAVANLGNDSDTAAAVAGAMAGAVYGLGGILPEWRDAVRGEWPIKSGTVVGASDLVTLADALVDLGSRSQPQAI